MRPLGYPLYVNGRLFNEPVTISHVPGMGAVDPSMGALGQYVAYAPRLPPLGADEVLPGSTRASLAPVPPPPPAPASEGIVSPFLRVWKYIAPVSSLACAYHGYRRNDSILWALWWGLVGSMPITPIIALAQGFGKRKGMTPNRRRKTKRRRNARTKTKWVWLRSKYGSGRPIKIKVPRDVGPPYALTAAEERKLAKEAGLNVHDYLTPVTVR